jgi:type II secretory pathway component PulF
MKQKSQRRKTRLTIQDRVVDAAIYAASLVVFAAIVIALLDTFGL